MGQNYTVRVVTELGRREQVTTARRGLHWLPVYKRVAFKVLSLVFRALNCDEAPAYLRDLLSRHVGGRALRSGSDCSGLEVPRSNNKYGGRSFSVCVAALWNALPCNIRELDTFTSFKAALKTHLFCDRFN